MTARRALRPVAPATARPAPARPKRAPAEGSGIFTTFDPHLEIDEVLPEGATVLDYLFAVDRDQALRLKALRINGKSRGFDTVPVPGDDLEYFVADQPTVNRDWLGFVNTGAARKVILQATALPAGRPARYPSRQTEREDGSVARKDKGKGGFDGAKSEVTGNSYRQPGREGKKLIGAYVPEEDIPRFKAILKARGTNTQEYFAQIVANELAAAGNPAELERLMEAQLERFRATFRHLLPKPKR